MTERDYLDIADYIETITEKMNLTQWRINLSTTPLSRKDAEATIIMDPHQYSAQIELRKGFKNKLSLDRQRYVIVHELVHLYLYRFDRYELYSEKFLSKKSEKFFDFILRDDLEYTVDSIAYVIAQFMPYPEWSDKQEVLDNLDKELDNIKESLPEFYD